MAKPSSIAHEPMPCVEQVCELKIAIYPRSYVRWIGTGAQLQAEGLIPADFEWPNGLAKKYWTAGKFEYQLLRVRPEGHKGPRSSYLEVDNWDYRRGLLNQGFEEARIYEARVALEKEIWTHTPAAIQHFGRYWTAHEDKSFQSFKSIFMPQPKKSCRPSKPKVTSQGSQQ